ARERLDEAVRNPGGQLAGEPAVAGGGAVIRAQCALAEGGGAQARAGGTRLRGMGTAAGRPLGDVLSMLGAHNAPAPRGGERAGPARAGPAGERLPSRADGQLCRARLLLATGDDKGALAASRDCLDGSAAGATRRDRVAALLTAAVAQRRLSQVADAAESI